MIKFNRLIKENNIVKEANERGLDRLAFGMYGKDGRVTHIVDRAGKLTERPIVVRLDEAGIDNRGKPKAYQHGQEKPGSRASAEAKQKGLEYMKFGRWGKGGQVTHKTDPSGKLIPVASKPQGAPAPRAIRSRNPEGPRSGNALAQAPAGDYGNTDMPTSISAKSHAAAGGEENPNANYGDEERRGTGGTPPDTGVDRYNANRAGVRNWSDEHQLPTQVRVPTPVDLEKAQAAYKSIDPTQAGNSDKAYLLGHVSGMLGDLQKHNGNAAELARKYQEVGRRLKMNGPNDWPAVRTNALKAYAGQQFGPEAASTEEPTPRDASGASHFGTDESVNKLSPSTMSSYTQKASRSAVSHGMNAQHHGEGTPKSKSHIKKVQKRLSGIEKATNKMSNTGTK